MVCRRISSGLVIIAAIICWTGCTREVDGNSVASKLLLGCYQDVARDRVFAISPGVLDPSHLPSDPSLCARECGYISNMYAGVWNEQFCFCADSIAGLTKSSSAACTTSEIDSISVYAAILDLDIPDLDLELDNNAVTTFAVGAQQNISIQGNVAHQNAVKYQLKYEANNYTWENLDTNKTSVVFIAPGVKDLTVQVVHSLTEEPYAVAAREVLVTEGTDLKYVNLSCPSNGATGVSYQCTIMVDKGSYLNGTVSWGNEFTEDFQFPNLQWERAGIPVGFSQNNLINGGAQTTILVDAVFKYPGYLERFELFAAATGTVNLMLLRPNCGGGSEFCFASDACSSAGYTCDHSLTCSSGEYLPVSQSCSLNCSQWMMQKLKANRTVGMFSVVGVTQVNLATTGYHTVTVNDSWTVEPGDQIGFYSSTANIIAAKNRTSEGMDFELTSASAPSLSESVGSSWTSVNVQHQVSAVARPINSMLLDYTWNFTGIHTVKVTFRNPLLDSADIEVTANASIELGINHTDIFQSGYAVVNENTTFQLYPHTGSLLNYAWNFGDGQTQNTTSATVYHTFTSMGTMNASVTIWNQFDSKSDFQDIIVLDRVVITSYSVPNATINQASTISINVNGTNFTCSWSIGSLLTTTTSAGTLSQTLTPTAVASHPYTINCTNVATWSSISGDFNVYEPISGVSIISSDVQVNNGFYLRWSYTQGSNVTSQMVVDNTTIASSDNNVAKTGETTQLLTISTVKILTVSLHVSNPISTLISVCNVSVNSLITGASLNSSSILTVSQNGTFAVSATTGSAARLNFTWGDGALSSYCRPAGIEWSSDFIAYHSYNTPGRYEMSVLVDNGVSNVTLNAVIFVLTTLGSYTLAPLQSYYDVGAPAQFRFQRLSGSPALKTNVSFYWGDSATPEMYIFDVNATYNHTYSSRGRYNVVAMISNPISSAANCTIYAGIYHTVENLTCRFSPENVGTGKTMLVTVGMTEGDFINVTLTPGDGTTSQMKNLTYATPSATVEFDQVYSSVGVYNMHISACNWLGCRNCTHSTHVDNILNETLLNVDVASFGSLPSGPVNVSFRWNGASGTFPSNTNYSISFNDGTSTLTGSWSASANPLLVSRSFTSNGSYTGQIQLNNYASSYTKNTSVYIYQDFSNIQVSALYRPAPTAALQEGMGPDKDKYPPNTDIEFTIKYDTGKAEWLLFSFQLSGNLTVNTCNVTGSNTSHVRQFSEIGTYSISILAYNPAFTKTAVKNITIGGSLRNLVLESKTESWRPLISGQIQLTWEVLTTDSCICVDFGDDSVQSYHDEGRDCSRCGSSSRQSSIPVTPPLNIYKLYSKAGNYIVKVTAYNDYANKTLSLDLPVGSYNCKAPVLDIDPSTHSTPANAKIVERSVTSVINGVISSLPCNMTYQNTKAWTMFRYDIDRSVATTAVNLSSIKTNANRLDLPANFLDYGYYELRFTVTMNQTITVLTFSTTATTFLRIIPTNIIVRLVSGGMAEQTRGYKEMITLSPKLYSLDPDLSDNNADQGIGNWTWYCRRSDEAKQNFTAPVVYPKPEGYSFPSVRHGCFGYGPGRINTTSGTFTFWAGNMEVNKTYIIGLEATKGTRKSDTELQILIVAGEPPIITIECRRKIMCKRVTAGQFKDIEQSVNPSETLQLVSQCSGGNCLPSTYSWKISRYDANATSDDTSWIQLDSKYSVHISGIDSGEVSISPALFTAIEGVKRFKACFNAGEGTNKGFGCLQFVANTLPEIGECKVSPSEITVETVACITCSKFTDSDGIESYTFIVSKRNENPSTLGFNRTGVYCSKLPYSTYPIEMSVEVRDTLGGIVYLSFANITIKKMELSALNGALDKLLTAGGKQSLDEKFAKGDFASMGSAIIETAALLDAINSDSSEAAAEPEEEQVTNQNKRTDLITELVNHLDKMNPQEESTLKVTASALKGLSGNDKDMRRDSQEKIMSKAFESADVLDAIVGTMSKESVVEVGAPLISAVINTLSMCNVQIDDPVPRDLDEAKLIMEYDTDLESDSNSFSGGDLSQAANSLARETSASSQKQAAKKMSSTGFSKVIKKVQDVMLKVMVPGDKPIVYDTGKGNMSFHKPVSADAVKNSSLASGNATVKIPDICGSLEKSGLSCNGSAFGMTFISTKFNAMSALPTNQKGGVPLGAKNPVITLSISTENGTAIGVDTASDGASEEFDIDVPMPDETIPFEPGNPSGGQPYLPDPVVRPGTGGYLSETEYIWQKLFMHSLEINGDDQSVHFEMRFNVCTQFLVVGKLAEQPSLMDDTIGYDFFGMIPSDIKYCNTTPNDDEPNPYTLFVDNQRFKEVKTEVLKRVPDWQTKKRNMVYFGVRELRTDEHNVYVQGNPPPFPYPYTENITTNYDVRPFSKCCYTVNEDSGTQWGTGGCRVSNLTTAEKTKCLCTHLTSFSGGWAVAPNTIDFSYVFANFDFAKNPSLFATEISIFVIYILAMVWAYFADKKDIEKLGVTPLPDNDPKDQYLYELSIQTGIRMNAGTDSKVCLILSGEEDETDVRVLRDDNRKILQRSDINRFLLSVPRPLGNLQYVRIWHDNSGKGSRAGWYCAYIGVLDLQTRLRYHFMVNQWLAVEEADGLVDRLVPVAGPDEIARFGEMFARNAQRDLTDGHLWISVMTRPPESRFTRSARITVCLFLLFLTMLATCMFYRKPGSSDKSTNALELGPFRLSPEQVYIGVITNLITFLPVFIVVELFNRTRLYKSHSRSLLHSVRTHYSAGDRNFNSRSMFYREEEQQSVSTPRSDFSTELIPNEMPPPYSSRDRLCDTPRSMDQVSVQVMPTGQNMNETQKKKTKTLFPWWVRIFTWIFMALGTFVAAFFTTLYGIMFGDESCKQWLSSMFISFFASILFTQPIKVICLAVLISLICKSADNLEEEDEEDDIIFNEVGQRNGLKYGEEFLHHKTLSSPIKPRRIQYEPPSEEALEKAREYRMKEIKIYDVLREIGFYLFFFMLLLLVSYTFRDPNAYELKSQMVRLYTNKGHQTLDFSKIRNEDNFWNWSTKALLPALRAGRWYNNYPPLFQRGFVSDRAGRMMGYAVMRQLRVKDNTCVIEKMMREISNHCLAEYSFGEEDRGTYGPGWEPVAPNVTAEQALAVNPAFVYRDANALDGYPYIGQIGTYSGGGYAYELRGGVSRMTSQLLALRDQRWIDRQTRAIFIEFTTYIPNVNLFGMATMLLESPGTGGMWPSYRFEPANLLSFSGSGVKAFQIAYQALFVIMLIFYLVKEIRKMYKQRKQYFFCIWNWCELFIIGASFGSIAAFVFMVMATNKLTAEFAKYHGNRYIKFQFVAYWHENLSYAVSFIVFAATIKFIRLLRFNKRMGMLGAVLSHTGKDIGQFFILFALIFFAFVQVFYLLFMDSLYRYHTFLHSTEASMQIALGKFEFLELYKKEPYLGPLVFLGFVIFIIFVMLNMLLAILNEGFAVVRANMELQANEHELVDFLVRKLVLWSGMHQTNVGRKIFKEEIVDHDYKEPDPREMAQQISNFPEKVDQLIEYIDKIYAADKTDVNLPVPQRTKSPASSIASKATIPIRMLTKKRASVDLIGGNGGHQKEGFAGINKSAPALGAQSRPTSAVSNNSESHAPLPAIEQLEMVEM